LICSSHKGISVYESWQNRVGLRNATWCRTKALTYYRASVRTESHTSRLSIIEMQPGYRPYQQQQPPQRSPHAATTRRGIGMSPNILCDNTYYKPSFVRKTPSLHSMETWAVYRIDTNISHRAYGWTTPYRNSCPSSCAAAITTPSQRAREASKSEAYR